MRKIPTIFLRDPEDMSRVLPVPNADAAWVFAGQGTATRKYDGTCVGYLNLPIGDTSSIDSGANMSGLRWWARREVKPGKQTPPGFVPVQLDRVTGKTQGWEPIEQSGFVKQHAEAIFNQTAFGKPAKVHWEQGTYELAGPGINGDPDGWREHILLSHAGADTEPLIDDFIRGAKADAQEIFDALKVHFGHLPWEGIVWHHPSGAMAKLKRRDFGLPWPLATPVRPPR